MPDLYAIARGTTRLCRLTHYETRRVRGTEGEYVVAWLDDGSCAPWALTSLRVGTAEDWMRLARRKLRALAIEHGRTE